MWQTRIGREQKPKVGPHCQHWVRICFAVVALSRCGVQLITRTTRWARPENQAPTAVIDDAASGSLRVAAAVEVIVSAADSSDPDGDALTFAWTVDSACSASEPEDLTSVEIYTCPL